MKRKLKRYLAGTITDETVEEWASAILDVDKTEATIARWQSVQMELFRELFGDD